MDGDYRVGRDTLNNGEMKFVLPRGCRRATDGTVFIPRGEKHLTDILDKYMDQLPNQLVWSPRTLSDTDWVELKEIFGKRDCVIVGKGPSLNYLTAEDIPEGATVIAINEAIRKVEDLGLADHQLCMLQQDASLKDTCRPMNDSTIVLSSTNCASWYSTHPRMYMFNNHEMAQHTMSGVKAIKLAMLAGAEHIHILCFDGAMGGSFDYADCVGYDPGIWGKRERFKAHGPRLRSIVGGHPHTFRLPIDPSQPSLDSTPPLPDSPQEHHVSDDAPHSEHCTGTTDPPSETV